MKNGEAFLKRMTGLTAATLATTSKGPLGTAAQRKKQSKFVEGGGGESVVRRLSDWEMGNMTIRRGKSAFHINSNVRTWE